MAEHPLFRTTSIVTLVIAGSIASPARAQPAPTPLDPPAAVPADPAPGQGAPDEANPERPAAPGPVEPAPIEPAPIEPAPIEPAPAAGTTEPTADEIAEIEAALAADAAADDDDDAAGDAADGAAPKGAQGPGVEALLPDISVILDVATAYFTEDENLQTGGHDPTSTGFHLQQLEISLSKSVDPYFRFDSNLVFSLFGVEVEEAYATTLALPFNLQARAGQFLTRFGRLNPTHPHAWAFVDQPFYLGRVFGGEGNRGLGVELSVLLPLPWYVEVLGSTTGAAGESTARSFYGAEDQGVDHPLDLQNTAAIKQFFELSDNWSLLWGLSGANGPNPTGDDTRTDVFGTDLYVKYRPIDRASHTIVSLQLEALLRRRQVPEDVLTDAGGYAQVFWRFAQRWGTAARYELSTPVIDSAADEATDPLDPEHTDFRHRASANLTFWPTEFSRLRLQGSGDFPTWLDQPIGAVFLALEVVVGSHGAHAF